MGEHSGIEWTDHTFNPWWGCARVSPACEHCYAETFSKRLGKNIWGVKADRRLFGDDHWHKPLQWNRKVAKKNERKRVFSGSMCDVFDKNAPEGARDRLWALIRETPMLGLAAAYQTRSEHREIPSRRLGQWLSECLARGHS